MNVKDVKTMTYKELERELSEVLGSKVAVLNGRGNKGKLVIHYHGLDALDGILDKLRR